MLGTEWENRPWAEIQKIQLRIAKAQVESDLGEVVSWHILIGEGDSQEVMSE